MTVKIPPEQFARVAKVDFYLGTFAVLAAVGYLAFLLSNSPRADRYIGYQAGSFVYVLDQTTGAVVRQCSLGDCAPVKR